MAVKFLAAVLSVLPLLTNADILVEIMATDNADTTLINYFGEVRTIVDDFDRDLFGLRDQLLKSAVEKLGGIPPESVHLSDPTPWGDYYSANSMKPTSSILRPLRARIVSVESVPVAVLTQTFSNAHSTSTANFNVELKQRLENKVTSSWTSNQDLSFGVKVDAGIKYNIFNLGGGLSFSYNNSWGNSNEVSETVTIGTKSGVQVSVGPGEAVIAELIASRGTIQIEVDYEATLAGHVLVKYASKHYGSQLWWYDIERLLEAEGMPRVVLTKETFNIGYFSEGQVNIYDGKTRRAVAVVPVEIKKEES